jgi:hypothetical protein
MAFFALLGVLSPRRGLYPPACKPYGLEAEPEAAGFRLPAVRGAQTLACPAIALFWPTADAALRLRQGFAARVIRTIPPRRTELDTHRAHFGFVDGHKQ